MPRKTDNRLFTNVCGNKGSLLKHINDDYITIIEPYAGSAAISLGLNTRAHIILGETDPILFACYRAWLAGTLELPDTELDENQLVEAANTCLTNDLGTLARKTLAAAYVFRQSTYGSVMRTNKQGQVNVKVAQDKLKRAMKRPIPDLPGGTDILLLPSAEKALATAVQLESGTDKTLLVLDPPYFNPGSTPCYPFHNPKDDEETLWAIMNVSTAITCHWDCILTAYVDDGLRALLAGVVNLAAESGYIVKTLSDQPLTTLGNQAKGETEEAVKPKEVCLYFQKDSVEYDFLP